MIKKHNKTDKKSAIKPAELCKFSGGGIAETLKIKVEWAVLRMRNIHNKTYKEKVNKTNPIVQIFGGGYWYEEKNTNSFSVGVMCFFNNSFFSFLATLS